MPYSDSLMVALIANHDKLLKHGMGCNATLPACELVHNITHVYDCCSESLKSRDGTEIGAEVL